ncbi:hypothetical protein [Halosegnis rubeus]|uniref:Uncharacterized protein n=1 Tax=Halosegnis rubeus TaxID=2212850 RepID=A0A5N5UKW6_9EURY|nr:hypothetical protein [Halosegnis rubeus]KAB7519459.1 hypothetical protein DP108_04990 [Halosegnis rubeus]
MSKRRVERDIEELEEEALSELTPEERFQLWLEAAATEKQVWLDKLRETAPTIHYRGTDLAFVERSRAALMFLNDAIYNLHTTCLQYELVAQHQRLTTYINLYRGGELTDEPPEPDENVGEYLPRLFFNLYTYYYSYQRFATEILGVPFETWATLHSDGPFVLDQVEDVLDNDFLIDWVEEWLNDGADVDDSDSEGDAWVTVDDFVEAEYHVHVETWQKALERIP